MPSLQRVSQRKGTPAEETGVRWNELSGSCGSQVCWRCDGNQALTRAGMRASGGPSPGTGHTQGTDEICILHCPCISCYMGERLFSRCPKLGLGAVFSLDTTSNKKTNCVGDGDGPQVCTQRRSDCFKKKGQSELYSVP